MEVKKFLIAGGNATALVWGCSGGEYISVAKELMSEVEQVGFVYEKDGRLYLEMMGGELCVNAMIALASLGGERGEFGASGVAGMVKYENGEKTQITLPLPYVQKESLVLFEGIGYLCIEGFDVVSKELLVSRAREYNLPAFGVVQYEGSRIKPTVYVTATDSLCEESACGSGSIAMFLSTGIAEVTQPTGESIVIAREGELFSIEAKVKPIE